MTTRMPIFTQPIPLSIYIHLPWCIRKCPYCDFNSHEIKGNLPEAIYTNALLNELHKALPFIAGRPIISLFFGGGTPSLFSPMMIEKIIDGIAKVLPLSTHTEITLEANPGTVEQTRFKDFRNAGINRLSLGIQSLQNDKLSSLGRIHNADEALRAIAITKAVGFTDFNLDLMFGLPNQSQEDALYDLKTALSFEPTHLSWYQLTIEQNTVFYKHTPRLPHDETLEAMEVTGHALIAASHFQQYEVSAYALNAHTRCKHNINYWEFGDYLGLGAGAHSKLTLQKEASIIRLAQVKQPRDYMDASKRRTLHAATPISQKEIIFEFMLNALRLTEGVPLVLFTERTGLSPNCITPLLGAAQRRGLLVADDQLILPSQLGKKYLNDLVEMFLECSDPLSSRFSGGEGRGEEGRPTANHQTIE
ncbi:MAG: YggW family oxidoreductase [Gammaproteobacteria bacterium RIFCSPHIGHO2_12_FULL_42_10]|nr:MAG: YggW family oxidoreductase [Gammaproteobacteria bacterium RIFCSPHIGHO2_12_FULL_42_10]